MNVVTIVEMLQLIPSRTETAIIDEYELAGLNFNREPIDEDEELEETGTQQ